jgi:glycosyltransferase involved in cell wall biosynthesis
MHILTSHDSYNSSGRAKQPFFSVIITTYNRANLLKKALDSLLSQTEQDWEAIIVDDESTDDTCLQILNYQRSNPAIRYIRKIHSWEALSKNTGIELSTGKFITFLDSDDEYDPLHLQSRKNILLRDPTIKFLHGGVKIIGNQYVPDRFDYNKKIHLSKCTIGGTFFIEKGVMMQLKGFRKIILGTDADLFDRALEAGIPITETSIPTYIYHHENEDSITNKLTKSISGPEKIYSDPISKYDI